MYEMMCIYMYLMMVTGIYMHFPLTQDGISPLYVASKNGHSDVVNILIRNGGDVNMAANVRYS